ncbi:NAD(P)-dependent oxidoreductase [Marinitenerispora sediminis]|uniref:3-hydroxyisobutyrate dehydrogenase n=1 Tax=Marinitenerispora sediminis TaxID=1931232 RepID=A0A368T428_9ACTN|nr:NAD(P)-dependent oxidoreductase [Marinitenerispora sediminis]RCV50343.1 3-hydroxyisobutyrate dehydrogenase [Marinitenerispora sediminis]RCV53619.1 3-hydroxyisobutyrate dehydrogenase [Marinitenerispora sediminis]RCV57915.1 3-hydroxyisobutyrate dehydrogenase [Marinitenerispora sediminis]
MDTSAEQPPRPTVAFLGTGTMGLPMARNIAAAGFPLRAWNRTRARAEPLADAGATVVDSPGEAVAGAGVIVTMLTDGPAVERVMAEVAEPPRGAVWVQSSTVGPEPVRRLAAIASRRGLTFVDAPVVGTAGPAENGTLTVLAAGDRAAAERVAALFDAIGERTIWAGEAGAASALKLVVNSWVLALNTAAGEAVALAEALDVDPRRFLETVSGGALDAGYLHAKTGVLLSEDPAVSFSVANAAKDAHLILDAARAAGIRLDLAAASAARLDRAARHGHAARDMAAAYYASFDEGAPG